MSVSKPSSHKPLVKVVQILLFLSMIILFGSVGLYASTDSPATNAPLTGDTPTANDTSQEIVYLSSNKQIRVYDPVSTNASTPIKWTSQNETGFYDFALGNVNANPGKDTTGVGKDEDKEIIAIHETGLDGQGGQMVIYDPVVISGQADGAVEGVSWRKLATIRVGGQPNVIASGNFDPAIFGDEILVGYLPAGGAPKYRVDVYKDTSTSHDGTKWEKHASKDFDFIWRDTSVGQVFADGPDEVAFIAGDLGRVYVYRFDQGFSNATAPSCQYERKVTEPSAPAYDAVILQWVGGGNGEIAIVRAFPADGTVSFPRLYVFPCEGGDFKNELFTDKFNPTPFTLFAVDTNKNNEDEIYMLRNLDASLPFARLIARGNGANNGTALESALDSDNGYQSGTGGDVNGDGRKDVVLMRNNRIRIYTDVSDATPDIELGTDTNTYSIEIGDLDINGTTNIPPQPTFYSFTSSRLPLAVQVPSGEEQTDPDILINQVFNLTILNNAALVRDFSIQKQGNLAPFQFKVIGGGNTTPAQVRYWANGIGVAPGSYIGNLAVTSTATDVVTAAFSIPVTVTVTAARIATEPSGAAVVLNSCSGVTAATTTLKVTGTAGIQFELYLPGRTDSVRSSAVEMGYLQPDEIQAPPWLVKVEPATGQVGDTLTITVDPSQIPASNFGTAKIVLEGDARTGGAFKVVPVSLLCASSQTLLPSAVK